MPRQKQAPTRNPHASLLVSSHTKPRGGEEELSDGGSVRYVLCYCCAVLCCAVRAVLCRVLYVCAVYVAKVMSYLSPPPSQTTHPPTRPPIMHPTQTKDELDVFGPPLKARRTRDDDDDDDDDEGSNGNSNGSNSSSKNKKKRAKGGGGAAAAKPKQPPPRAVSGAVDESGER
jgi:hypothetical protein